MVRLQRNIWGQKLAYLTSKPPPTHTANPTHSSLYQLLQPPSQEVRRHYANVTDPPSLAQFLSFVQKCKGSSAPGPSLFRYCMLKNAAPTILEAVYYIVSICLKVQGFPKRFKVALLFPIPKAYGPLALTNMRPIALLEIVYKLTTGWLAQAIRTAATSAPTPLLHSSQFGSKADSVLQEPLFLLQAILEDAAEHPLKDLWVVLADVQAAFDSVGPGSKALTMRAAGLPESAINLIIDADDSASISVITPAAGISDPFPAQQGYRQGDPFSVLGWLLFINPLLVWLADGLPATAPTVNHTPSHPIQQKHNDTHLRCDNPPMEGCYQLSHSSTRQPSLTFIDDGA